jgi:Uma2 family endonuclease
MAILEKDLARPSPPRMTFEEFLAWADEDTWAEWVDGEVIFLTATRKRQLLQWFLSASVGTFAQARSLGAVLGPPFVMKTGADLPGREPDLLFVATDNLHRLQEKSLEGPADLVVEIVSADSRTRDRVDKFKEYAEGGVREYWLLDPERQRAAFFVLGEDGRYQSVPVLDGVFHSTVLPGLSLRVEWLWTRPQLLDVLREWELV